MTTFWNPYIDIRVEESRAVRAACRQCGAPIERGSWRIEAVPVVGKPELLHVDCAAKRAPDLCARKLKDKDPDWPGDVQDDLKRFVKPEVPAAPRSYQRTPLLDLSYDKDAAGMKPCVFCGEPAPKAGGGPSHGHAVRAFSIDGERRFHPECIVTIAPGLCKRVVAEDGERWPAEVKAFFGKRIPPAVQPIPRSPWRNTAGLPAIEHAPSARAACRFCSTKIEKGELRLAREQVFGMRRTPVYFHVRCYGKSDDWHPKMLELVVLRSDDTITRADIESLKDALPPDPPDDDAAPLLERLLALHDLAIQKRIAAGLAASGGKERPKPTENVIEIPDGFFTAGGD